MLLALTLPSHAGIEEFRIGFTSCTCGDNEIGSDVGSVSCQLIDEDGDGASEILQVLVANAYPGYKAHVDLEVANQGSIGGKILAVQLEGVPGWAHVEIENLKGLSISPGESVEACLNIQVLSNAPERSIFQFQATIIASDNCVNNPPHIEDETFVMEIFMGEVKRDRSEAKIPYVFAGETVNFQVDVCDYDGIGDIMFDGAVSVILSSNSGHEMEVPLKPVEELSEICCRFEGEWQASPEIYGLFEVSVRAQDTSMANADNSGVTVGLLFVNPRVSISLNISKLSFGSRESPLVPGQRNISASQNPVVITNLDPDDVGMRVDILICGEDFKHENSDVGIPISNMWIVASQKYSITNMPRKIGSLTGRESLTCNFYMDVPDWLPAGKYFGKITIIPIVK